MKISDPKGFLYGPLDELESWTKGKQECSDSATIQVDCLRVARCLTDFEPRTKLPRPE